MLIEKAHPQRLAFTFLSLALSKGFAGGTTILWRDELPPEAERRCHIALEGDTWVQRDGLGRAYGIHPDARAGNVSRD